MKVQSSLDLNKFELRNAIVQQQAGPLQVGWKVGLLQLDTQNSRNKLMLGISDAAAGQGGYLERENYLYLLDSRIGGVANDMLAGFSNNSLDIESALTTHFPSCAAVKTFFSSAVTSVLIYKGTLTPAESSGQDITASMFIEGGVARTTLPTTKGWVYKCTASGWFGSIRMETGDTIICNGGTAGTTSDYDIVQGNIDLLNIPELRVVTNDGNVDIGGLLGCTIAFYDSNEYGPTLSRVENGDNRYLLLSSEDDGDHRFDNLKTSGWIDAGALKENGTALASKYYLASNPAGYISGITKAMVEAVLTGSITSHSHNYIANAANAVLKNHISAGAVTTAKIADAAVTIAKLANSALTIGSTSVALGDTAASLEGLTTIQVQELRIGDSDAYISLSFDETGSPAVIDVSGVLDASSLRENGTALSAKYLGISAKAADADKLDGYHATAFLVKADGGTLNGNLEVNKPSGQSNLTLSTGSGASLKSSSITHTDSGVMTISPYGNLEIDGTVIPAESDSYDLGSAEKAWVNLYAETIYEDGTSLSAKYAAMAHTHDYLPLAGGTLTGNLTISHESGANTNITLDRGDKSSSICQYDNGDLTIAPYRNLEIDGNTIPGEGGDYDLGSSSKNWNNLYATTIYEDGQSLASKYAPAGSYGRIFRTDITGNASTTTFTLTHGLGTQSPIVQIYEASTHEQVLVDVVANAANTVRVTFGAAPANGKVYNVVIMG